MKKNYILSLLAAAMLFPFTAIKAQYDAGDSTVCYNIMTNNFATSNLLNWNDPDPGNWLGVVWNSASPQRIIQLELDGDGDGDGMGVPKGGNVGLAVEKYTNINGSGVNSKLTGLIDFTALTELYALDLRKQDSITGINVTGLNNLEYFIMSKANGITTLDLSNLPNLQHIHTSNLEFIQTLNASNCPRLKKLMVKRGNATLTNVNVSGSDSIRFLNLKSSVSTTSPQTSFDLTGKTQLYNLIIHRANISSFPGLSTCNQLTTFRVGRNKLIGTININDFDSTNLYRFGLENNKLDAVTGWTSQISNTNLSRMSIGLNHLTLDNATQIGNEVNAFIVSASPQTRYGGDTTYVPATIDYSAEALIDINGNNIASSFQLFDFAGTPVGPANATGIFNFPTTLDTGEYYVEMTNPGAAPGNNSVLLVTNLSWIRCTSASGSQTLTICAGDSLIVGTSVYKTTGVFIDPFLMVDGCDSLLTTNLTVAAPIDTATTASNNTIISNAAGGASYEWIDCSTGFGVLPPETNQSFTATVNGDYAVVVTVGSCSDTSACVNIATVGINELDANDIVRAYPNPMNEMVTIELEKAVKNTQITIVNVEGKTVYNNIINNTKVTVDGADWTNGIYIIKITNDEYTKTLKLIK